MVPFDVITGPTDRLFAFVGGAAGPWAVVGTTAIVGAGLPAAARVEVVSGAGPEPAGAAPAWVLRGVVSNERYVTRAEKDALVSVQPPLARPDAIRAALIPIKKTAAWWALTQDERRAIFEERSAHIAIGMGFLPAIARRLHHGRDLGEPFDFLTWFEFAAVDEGRFDELLARLRATEEWRYVEREVDVRLARAAR
jgi:chlorite dismutase